MTAPCRLLRHPRSSFPLGLDSFAQLPLPPPHFPRPLEPPPAPSSPLHTTQHTNRCKAPRSRGEQLPAGLCSQQPLPLHTLALLDKANSHLAAPCTCCVPLPCRWEHCSVGPFSAPLFLLAF